MVEGYPGMQCIKCGRCCTGFELVLDNGNPRFQMVLDWLNTGNMVLPFESVRNVKVVVQGKCKYLTEEGCSIYGKEERPEICRVYKCWEDQEKILDGLKWSWLVPMNAKRLCSGTGEEVGGKIKDIISYYEKLLRKGGKKDG